jgi:hypothetical protein
MKVILSIICGVLLFSCASRKVTIAKEDTKIITDSNATIKTDSVSITKNNIKYTENYSELEIKPLNDSLPIVIDGTSYFNVVLKYKKQNKELVNTSTKIVSKKALKKVYKTKQETKSIKNKTIDKKANYFVYLWLLLIPIGMYIYRKIKEKILL